MDNSRFKSKVIYLVDYRTKSVKLKSKIYTFLIPLEMHDQRTHVKMILVRTSNKSFRCVDRSSLHCRIIQVKLF